MAIYCCLPARRDSAGWNSWSVPSDLLPLLSPRAPYANALPTELRGTPSRMRKRQNQRTPSSGLSATYSPCQGEKGLREALEYRFDKSLTASCGGPTVGDSTAVA